MIGSSDTKKGHRHYQEDRYNLVHNDSVTFLDIFDGHGGDEVSEYCAKNVSRIWNSFSSCDGTQRLRNTIKKLHEDTMYKCSGSTASMVFIKDNIAYCAVLGDSPIITKDIKGRIRISPEHNVRTNHKEVLAACKRGGRVVNGYLFAGCSDDGLQMSRALGDYSLRSVLSRIPQTYTVKLGEGSWVMVGSDGVLDPVHQNKDAAKKVVYGIENGWTAVDIVDNAIGTPTYDNATAILVRV